MCSNEFEKHTKEEEENMNACAIKPDSPFVTNKLLRRTPASPENAERSKFINSHNFSLNIDDKKNITVSTNKKS